MSLLLFLFYWVVIPVLVFLITKWLFHRVTTPFQKRAVVAVSVAVFLGLLWMAAGEKWWFDYQVRDLCAKDGGVKVYETVKLPAELVSEYGGARLPSKERAKPEDKYYYEMDVQYIKHGNPEMWRDNFKVYRRSDQKLIGESVKYARRGGDLPGPWHPSSFICPSIGTKPSLEDSIFLKGDTK